MTDKKFIAWYNHFDADVERYSVEEMLHIAFNAGRDSMKKKSKKDPHPAYSWCVEHWLKEVHPGWSFNAIEGKALNEIIGHMERYFSELHLRAATVQETFDFFKHFCAKLPNFYKTKQLRVLNQNFDGIIAEIRTGRKTGSTVQQSFSKFAGR